MNKRKNGSHLILNFLLIMFFTVVCFAENSNSKDHISHKSTMINDEIYNAVTKQDSDKKMMPHGMMGHGMMNNMMKGNKINPNNSTSVDTANTWAAPSSADKLKNPLAGIEKVSEETKKNFNQDCVTCHGNEGKGDGPTSNLLEIPPADLTSAKVQKQSDGAIFWKITTGKGYMPSFKKTFKDKQRWEMVNYIRLLGKNKGDDKK